MADNEQKKQESNNKKNEQRTGMPAKPPIAVFVWLLIFITIIILVLYNAQNPHNAKEWDQSMFEEQLRKDNLETIVLSPESNLIVQAEGRYKVGDKTNLLDSTDNYYIAKLIYSDSLDKEIRASKSAQVTVKNRENWVKTLLITILPIVIIIAIFYFLFSRQIKMAGKGAMQFGKSKARMIFPDEHRITFDDVAGADEAKEETMEIIEYLKDPLKFKMLGGRIPKGALLMGPPGTGKTLLAKAVAGEANVPFFAISGSDFVEMFVGVGASRVRDMFDQARRHCPCLIFIDEIDAVGRSRFSGIGGGHDEREQTLNALLVEMDGLETQEGVIILAATNRPDVLDPALQRPGRFDRQVVIDLPDIKGRRKILDVHVKNVKVNDGVDLDVIARGTPGFSGADLASLVNEAALLAAKNDQEAACMADFEEARDKVRWGRERKSRTISEKERKITAYHEAGHTLIGLHSPNAMPLHKVTIIPRGRAYLGATMHLPEEDRYTQSKAELLDQLNVCMGGRVAEEMIFDDITSGAAGDIEMATNIARSMVCAFGMSDKMGMVQYGERSEHIYLGRDITKSEAYSEETAREIDLEIKQLVTNAHNTAIRILEENREQLDLLAKELLDKETLDVSEIKKLLGMPIEAAGSEKKTTVDVTA